MSASSGGLGAGFAAHVRDHGGLSGDETLMVGVSGGVDSLVLLHLLRFGGALPACRLIAVHVDHGMRPDSVADAAWVHGLTRAWGVELRTSRLHPAPGNEAEARRLRYAALDVARREAGADLVLTAHHADDQAETVLFRVLRGTGLAGLRGIHERRAPALWRPLLPFGRDEILAYACDVGLGWREDPTNAAGLPRNVIRHRLLPVAEASVAPGARRALVRLARRAREDEAGWRSLLPGLLRSADLRTEDDGFSLLREAVVGHHPAVRARLLRTLARRLGEIPEEAGTRLAVEFTSSGESGAEVPVSGDVSLRRELDRLVVARRRPALPDTAVAIGEAGFGEGDARVGGIDYRVRWSCGGPFGAGWQEAFGTAGLHFPLAVRAWEPGDRTRMRYGSKKLKKLWLEARVPPGRRHRIPVVADAAGEVLWVPDLVRSTEARPGADEHVLYIGITHADSD